jgi:hypothetical protein
VPAEVGDASHLLVGELEVEDVDVLAHRFGPGGLGDSARRADARRASRYPAVRAMADTSKIAKNLERFAQAIAAHDRENPTHTAWGIGLAHFDMERLGLEEGEEILPGIVIQADNGVTGNFRVLCDGQHDGEREAAEEEVVEAVATTTIGGDPVERRSF